MDVPNKAKEKNLTGGDLPLKKWVYRHILCGEDRPAFTGLDHFVLHSVSGLDSLGDSLIV